ncbi:MAG TPA: signal peptidase I [Candidatus Saccharimonadales bacterium]|nr:signal peptidase I [Candidatus Saccharimonadales bacterium]
MRLLKAVWLWLQVAGGAVAIVAVAWLAAQSVFHLHLLNVQTGSMRPAFRPGDALIMRRATATGIKVGDIVSYHSSRNPKELVTHRVVTLRNGSFQTQGDALRAPDPTVRSSLLAGKITMVLPGMGRLLGWLQSLPGLVVCVYLPAAAIAVSELARFEKQFSSDRIYRLVET